MKALVLAAGRGNRLFKYTQDKPKGMLDIGGKSILERQRDIYRSCGISDLSVVTGYLADTVDVEGFKKYDNAEFGTTNMVESLMRARDELNDDVILSYADILFEKRIADAAIKSNCDFGVVVDTEWKDYWQARYNRLDFDLESFKFSNGKITEIGKSDPPVSETDGRYVGILRFSKRGCQIVKDLYDEARSKYAGKPWLGGRLFEKIYMTDLIQELVDRGHKVEPIQIQRGWWEFDLNEDYELFQSLKETGQLEKFIQLQRKQ